MRFGTLHLDINDMDSNDKVRQEIVRRARERGLLDGIARVYLEGDQHPDIDLDVEALLSSLTQSFTFFVDIVDASRPPYDYSTEAQGYNTKARFVREMLGQMEATKDSQARDLYETALILGLRAFEGRKLSPRQGTQQG